MATTGRPRAMSGTIPSMESSAHESLTDNTIIVGMSLAYPAAPPDHPAHSA